jgi:hypothetical protein
MQMILPAAQLTSLRTPRRLNSRTQELAGEIHIEHELPVGERHLVHGRVLLQPGVVHENVDGAELLDHLLEHRLHLVLPGDVRLVGIDICAATRGFLHHSLGRLGPRDVIHHHIRSGVSQRDGHGLANAGICSGHECLLPAQDFVNRAGGHHRRRQVFVTQMLLHEFMMLVGHRHRHAVVRPRRHFESVVHVFEIVVVSCASAFASGSWPGGNPYIGRARPARKHPSGRRV